MKTLVIDTNICLDLFVFHDQKTAALLKALESGHYHAITNHECIAEWEHVLHYKKLNLSPEIITQAKRTYNQLFQIFETTQPLIKKLPQCKDSDDQKFLILCAQANADFLLTKDKALLRLRRYCKNHALFTIASDKDFPHIFNEYVHGFCD